MLLCQLTQVLPKRMKVVGVRTCFCLHFIWYDTTHSKIYWSFFREIVSLMLWEGVLCFVFYCYGLIWEKTKFSYFRGFNSISKVVYIIRAINPGYHVWHCDFFPHIKLLRAITFLYTSKAEKFFPTCIIVYCKKNTHISP